MQVGRLRWTGLGAHLLEYVGLQFLAADRSPSFAEFLPTTGQLIRGAAVPGQSLSIPIRYMTDSLPSTSSLLLEFVVA